jgi:hypothetical protein
MVRSGVTVALFADGAAVGARRAPPPPARSAAHGAALDALPGRAGKPSEAHSQLPRRHGLQHAHLQRRGMSVCMYVCLYVCLWVCLSAGY